jgi:hypothetical protein
LNISKQDKGNHAFYKIFPYFISFKKICKHEWETNKNYGEIIGCNDRKISINASDAYLFIVNKTTHRQQLGKTGIVTKTLIAFPAAK